MTHKSVLATAAALLLFGFSASAEPAAATEEPERPRRCVPVSVSSASDGELEPPRRRRLPEFSAAEILDLELRLSLPRRLAGGAAELDLYTPKGHLYQTLSVPVALEDETPNDSRRRRGQVELTATLPVAGTTIVNSSLYGVWSVEVRLNGELGRCVRPSRFEITP